MSREWPAPLRDDALRLTIVSDMHHGRRKFTPAAMAHAGSSLDREADRTDMFLDLGDSIHWRLAEHKDPNDAAAKAWLAERAANTNRPWYSIGGNHDLQSYGEPYPNRSGDEWAADMGFDKRNHVIDWQDWARIIMVTPTFQGFDTEKPGHLPMELGTDEVAWVKARADEEPHRVTLVCFHAPTPAHYSGHVTDETANLIEGMLGNTPNVAAFLSGHRHTNLASDTRCFDDYEAGGRTLHWVNVPSFGGGTHGAPDDRWGQPFLSTHLTIYRDARIEVRCRDHMQARWVPWWRTGYVTTLPALTA